MKISEQITKYFDNEGFRYEVDDDEFIRFKFEGSEYVFCGDESDDNYFRIVIPYIYQVSIDERTLFLEAINKVSSEIKVVKPYLIDDYLFMSVEMFLDNRPNIEDFFIRCMRVIQEGLKKLYEEIRK